MFSFVVGWMALFLSLLPLQAKSQAAKPLYRISGIVVDAVSGQPISRAEMVLFLRSSEPTEVSNSTITGSDGKFAFGNLAPGKYTLRAQRRGYAPQAFLQHENYWTGIVVGPGMDAERIRFPLLPSASVSGQVLDEGGEPVRGAGVLLFERGVQNGREVTRAGGPAMTDDEGRFRFGHLLPGNYMVGVRAEAWYNVGARPPEEAGEGEGGINESSQAVFSFDPKLDSIYPTTFFPSSHDLSGAEVIRVHAGDAATADVRLQPEPALHLRLRVPVENETSHSNVLVTQTLSDGIDLPVRISQRVLSPGVMEISGLPPGHLNIHVDSSSSPGNGRIVHQESADLSGNGEMDATHASAQWNVNGVVKMEDGGALAPNEVVQLRDSGNGAVYATLVMQGGEFSFEKIPIPTTAGVFEIFVTQSADTFLKTARATGAKVSGSHIEFEEGKDVRLEIVLGRGMNSIHGLALRCDEPVGGAMILLLPEDFRNNTQLIRRDQSDSDGSFTMQQVPPGRYRILAIENGWELEWMKPEVLRKYLPGSARIDVRVGEALEIKVKAQ